MLTLAILNAPESRYFTWEYHSLPYSALAADSYPS
jgi:hypothetical protein